LSNNTVQLAAYHWSCVLTYDMSHFKVQQFTIWDGF